MTTNLLHKISNKDDQGLLSNKILTSSLQLFHRVPTFSFELFAFDFSLGFKVSQKSFQNYLFLYVIEML